MWIDELDALVALPRADQYAALKRIRDAADSSYEQWNTDFSPASLYGAWTKLPIMQGLYRDNRTVIMKALHGRSDWHIVELGGGTGALWEGFFDEGSAGTFTLIDPHPQAHNAVAALLPRGVVFEAITTGAEHADIPAADVIVCSLTLHHVAGSDAAQRSTFGLDGDGKAEVLQRCVAAIRRRDGVGVLNEADIYNEIDLAPGDPVLVNNFIDVYVRRTARAIAHAIGEADGAAELVPTWDAILRHWCLDQVDNAFLPRNERDVYELDTQHWTHLLRQAGAADITHSFTDDWNLFAQYLFR
jgi:Methyltransferase domain